MSRDESIDKRDEREPASDESPFDLAPIEGIPFDADSEEARAIERILRWTDGEGTQAVQEQA